MEMTGVVREQVTGVMKTASDLDQRAVHEIEAELRRLLADTFALYIKTKNCAERARKLGATTLRSISDITLYQRLEDSNREHVAPAGLIEVWIDQTERRTWFLAEIVSELA